MDSPHSDPKPSCKLQSVLIAYLVIAGGITAALLLMWISSVIKGSPAYRATFEALRSHPEAITGSKARRVAKKAVARRGIAG